MAAFALPHFQEGTIKPVIDRILDWTQVQEAHRLMESNANSGKIVLRVTE
jgi:NADPH:quinone reductase-like Zn-dependent oxidoreductase